jgi:hypothetical protein
MEGAHFETPFALGTLAWPWLSTLTGTRAICELDVSFSL